MTSITDLSTVESENNIIGQTNFVDGDLNKHYELICKMLINEYFQESILTKAFGAKKEEIEESYYFEICKQSLEFPVSILAFSGDKCIGWALNYILTDIQECFEDPNLSFNNDFTEKIANKGYGSLKFNKISVVMDEIKRNFAFFIPNCKKLFILRILFVQPFFEGNGIATKLTEKSIQLAQENGCDYILATSSNVKSAHILTKFGFKCVREISYDSFKENGQTFLQNFGDGNNSVRLMYLKL